MLTLAFGIGINVASFSVIEQVLLRPLPVAEPDRLVNLSTPGPKLADAAVVHTSVAGEADTVFTYPMFRDLERAQEPFTGIAAHRSFDPSLSTGERARLDTGTFVSGSYFSVLGLQPALGRLLGPQDDRVLSLLFALRYLLATRPEVVTQMLGIVYRAKSSSRGVSFRWRWRMGASSAAA